jgi:ABC-type multidrug transport system fused ATPase/permease subunit
MRKAQAWQFVSKLPDGIDTMIAGGRTGVLSGGQRQRLAIARALVRKPACLLLDEATSALDADTEEQIRLMLERELAERGMTTVIIAHRLSTIAKADCIVVMKDGRVVDQGRYEDLMAKDRLDQTFRQLAITQLVKPENLDDDVYISGPIKPEDDASHAEFHKVDSSSVAAHSSSQAIALNTDNTAVAAPLSVETHERRRSLQRFFQLVKTQKWFFLAGTLGGLAAGASFPVAQWMYGQVIDSLLDKDVRPSSNTWVRWMLVFAIAVLFVFL